MQHGIRDMGDVHDLTAAQRAVACTLLWNLRVLAGWAPPAGVVMFRIVAGWYEIANIEARLRSDDPEIRERPYDVGGLATSWRRLAAASTGRELHEQLTRTPWGRMADDSARATGIALRCRLLNRARSTIPGAEPWAAGGAALIVALEQLLTGRQVPAQTRRALVQLLGDRALEADSLAAFREQLDATAAWVLAGIDKPTDLWQAESRWWARVEHDGRTALRQRFGPEPMVGAAAVMATDAWRVRGALELAARGGRGREEFDALA